ncbi:MAG: DUF4240 domain-containing protein [Myxococcota bacterium]
MSEDQRSPDVIARGDTFVIRLENGLYGAVRVEDVCVQNGTTLVAIAPWYGERPEINEPILREVLRQNRGFYRNEPALSWYEGGPSADFEYLGRISSPVFDASLDVKGRFSGAWDQSVMNCLLGEMAVAAPDCSVSVVREAGSGLEPDWGRMLEEDQFWDVIESAACGDLFDEEMLEPAIAKLAELPVGLITAFAATLSRKLYLLDGEKFAKEIGRGAYGSGFFSSDHFLHARCAAVAMGRLAYGRILEDPLLMPKDAEFESLLVLADHAYRRKTGQASHISLPREIETFSNRAGWA